MANDFRRAVRTLRSKGLLYLLRTGFPFVYDKYVVPQLPRRRGIFNGVEVSGARLGDGVLPWRNRNKPAYESGLVAGIDEHVAEGDDAVIVGGGWGVTTVRTAQRTGSEGSVTVFEGSAREVEKVRETLQMNGEFDNVAVRHAIVGQAVDLRGEAGEAEHVSPDNLPNCDVLELDCEGSETSILREMDIRPRTIFVETHGMNDSPPAEIKNILKKNGYRVVSETIADKEIPDYCRKKGLFVLTALDERLTD